MTSHSPISSIRKTSIKTMLSGIAWVACGLLAATPYAHSKGADAKDKKAETTVAAKAETENPKAETQKHTDTEGRFQVGGGLGMMAGSFTAFNLSLAAEYHVLAQVPIGLRLTLGPQQGSTYLGLMATGGYVFKQPFDEVEDLDLFVNGGVGVSFAFSSFAGFSSTATSFAVEAGGGAQYWVLEDLALGSEMTLNFPVAYNTPVAFLWQVVRVRYLF